MLKVKSVLVIVLIVSILYPGIASACDDSDPSISGKKVVKQIESKHNKNNKIHYKKTNKDRENTLENTKKKINKSNTKKSDDKNSKKPNWFSRIFGNLYGTYVDGLRAIGRFLVSL